MPPPSVNPVPSTEPDTVLTTTDSHPADPVPSVETLKDAVPSPPSSPTPSASEARVSRPTSPSSQSTTSTSEPQRHFGLAEWVIWSRRPDDPASAPGIIFSPRSKPPPHIVRDALQIPQPPEVEPPPLEQEHEQESSSSSTVPSSDAAYTPTVPGSPISSNTSVSAPDSPPEEAKQEPLIEEATSLTPVPSIEPVSPPVVDTPVVPPPVKKSWASLLRSTDDAPSKNALPTSTVIGFSIPATPIAPITSPKKTALHTLLTTGSGAPVPHVIPRGLINTGNMCFANSVLQILLHCPPFLKLFHELGKLGYNVTEAPLTHATIEFLNEFVASKRQPEEERDSFIPAGIYDAMKEKKRFDNMRGGHQEDAEEFLGFYLDTLEEELLAMIAPEQPIPVVEEHEEDAPPVDDGWLEVGKKNRTVVTRTVKSTNSPITKIFGGKARSTLRAPSQKDSVIVEDWRALRLDIQPEHVHTIEDAVKHISDPQTIQRGDGMGDASQQMLVEALPAILILHVKRFHFDTTVGDVVKVGKQIVFGPELEIPLDIMAPTSRRPTKYKLFGAVYHHGVSASGGHYTLDVLHRENWIRIDDELVSDVRREDVFDAFERDESRTAYLLFYRRVR
ncbi:cysteine proteinase [Hymenopellis radicata]|nr:cysteine proteinase [Hymenopellis radicata]